MRFMNDDSHGTGKLSGRTDRCSDLGFEKEGTDMTGQI